MSFFADYRPIYSIGGNAKVVDSFLDHIHFINELAEHKRLLCRVFLDEPTQLIQLYRWTVIYLEFPVVLGGDAVIVKLWVDHTLADTQEALQDVHHTGCQVLCISEDVPNNLCRFCEYLFIDHHFLWAHIQFYSFNFTRGEPETFAEFCHILFSSPKDILLSDTLGGLLHILPAQPYEFSKGREVLDRIEDRCSRNNPPRWCGQCHCTLVGFGRPVANLVPFIEYNPIPLDCMKRSSQFKILSV